eukprot:2973103-Amphidinium_carterae.1
MHTPFPGPKRLRHRCSIHALLLRAHGGVRPLGRPRNLDASGTTSHGTQSPNEAKSLNYGLNIYRADMHLVNQYTGRLIPPLGKPC